MSVAQTKRLVTAEELLRLPDDGCRRELVGGELRQMAPAGEEHGLVAMRLGAALERHVREQGLGNVYAAETGFKLRADPDTVRAPDVAFVARVQLEATPPGSGYREGPPTLAVEVVSPQDRASEVAEKVYDWLHYGAEEVWVVDPGRHTVSVYRQTEGVRVLTAQETLRSPLLPGWELPVNELFTR